MPLLVLSVQLGHGTERPRARGAAPPLELTTAPAEPLRVPDSALEPVDWSVLDGWATDNHAAAFATFLTSCRPLVRTTQSTGEKRPMYFALTHVCRQALAAGQLAEEQARAFFEHNFRPVRITKLGDSAGLLTGYYEPIVDGSRFPTGIFKVPIYRRPPDLVAPSNSAGPSFPNRGRSLRRTTTGDLLPYYDRGDILDGVLDGQHLEICWIRDQMDALTIQMQGSARIRLEDGTMLHINYDGHNGYPYVPIDHILIERNIIPRQEMSQQRIREWMRANPQSAEEVLRQNRSFMFFRITGLSDDREAIGAQGVPLTPERSIAVDTSLHVYGTPVFIQASLPITNEKRSASFDHLTIAQDTGSAIVGPARADVYWGAGDHAADLAVRLHRLGRFTMLVPSELDPVAAGAHMPLPPEKPRTAVEKDVRKKSAAKSSTVLPQSAHLRRTRTGESKSHRIQTRR